MSKSFNAVHGSYSYEIHDLLGGGQFGSVYKGKNNKTGEIVAIKLMDLGRLIKKHGKEIIP